MLQPGKLYPIDAFKSLLVQMVENPVKCGFPSPAMDYLQKPIDLNDVLIKNNTATFLFIAEGTSMIGEHIVDGALLIIDSSIRPEHGHLILASINGEFTVKKIDTKLKRLMPANPAFEPIQIEDGLELNVFGVVTKIIIDPYLPYVRAGRR